MSPDSRLCLALDVSTADEAVRWVERTASVFATFKIGLQLFCAEGPTVVRRVRAAGARRIFLDLKLHDIPNTVAGAVRSLARLGIDDLTLHIPGGPAMMQAAVGAAAESGIRLFGVTVLTSLDRNALARMGTDRDVAALVLDRARLAVQCGLPGLVCSAREVAPLRDVLGREVELVTPGIRLATDTHGDQRRVTTPAMALADGADRLVIGRAVTAADDVDAALGALQAACGPRAAR